MKQALPAAVPPAEYIYTYTAPFGLLTLAADGTHLTGLWIEGQKYYGATLSSAPAQQSLPVFEQAMQWLDIYLSGRQPDFMPPLAPKGSQFRQAVWKILLAIPYGETTTYGAIARQLSAESGGKNVSAQAVGGAVGHNPISILIPCHRVVGSDGSLTGYAGGIGIKTKLLALEGVDMRSLYAPKRGTAL